MSPNSVLDLTQSLEQIIAQARTLLQQFSLSPRFSADIGFIFGQDVDLNQAQVIIQELATSNLTIPVNIRLASELQGANGAFAALTDSIYLNQQFLEQNNLATVTQVLLEEIGHAIDQRLNAEDTPGDEGQLFASVVGGVIPDSVTLS